MKKQQAGLDAISRRNFLKHGAGTGLVIGAGPLLSSCFGGGGDDADDPVPAGAAEKRTYYFNLPGASAQANHFLVAGATHHPLKTVDAAMLAKARADNPALSNVPDASLTHVGEALNMSAASIQVCYVMSVGIAGARAMHSIFYHVPQAATAKVAQGFVKQAQACGRGAFPSCRKAFLQSALAAAVTPATDLCDQSQYANYKDYFDHAVALVLNHPEVCSFDAPTLAYVHSLVCADVNIVSLAASLKRQGPATTSGGWAKLVPLIDPATGQPKLASDGATPLYLTQQSATTLQLTGVVIHSVLRAVKNDPQLGANITGLPTDTVNTGLQGKLWAVRDGTPTRRAASVAGPRAVSRMATMSQSTAVVPGFAALDTSAGLGFRFTDVSGDAVARTITFTAENWYLRYLGLYVRYLDAAGAPLPVSGLDSTMMTANFPAPDLNGTYDCFVGVLNQELVILGIPIEKFSATYTIPLPAAAASVELVAGGLGGISTSGYSETLTPGTVMTVALDLALPGVFLAMAAAQGYGTLSRQLSGFAPGAMINIVQALALIFTDQHFDGRYNDPALYDNVLIKLGGALVSMTAGNLGPTVVKSVGVGQGEGAVEDCAPFGIGLLIQAIMAAITAAQILESSTDVAVSPSAYVTQVALTHNLTVTIHHDPLDTAGFPATATGYRLTAVCDGGSPYDSGLLAMPGTTQTAPLSYTFAGMPSGGLVDITVTFTAPDGWLAGAGTALGVDNTLDAASVTITEILVPLTATTRYGHKQKTALSGGQHVWVATSQAPAAQAPNSNNVPGSLLGLTGITVSQPFASIGYSWQAYSAAVTSFGNGAQGQLYQFANISFTQTPQSAYLFSGQGFQAPTRLAYSRNGGAGGNNYYIDNTSGHIVRRINLKGINQTPTFDAPGSGMAVGQFNFASDAFLIHPTGKLISLNSELSKMEVIAFPADPPVADASAPQAQVMSGPGTRDGLLSGPVCASVAIDGTIFVLEQLNNRIQAFDTSANPTPYFGDPAALAATMPLYLPAGAVMPNYLDLAVESTGYIYVLSQDTQSTLYNLDIYDPTGRWVNRTSGVNARKLAVDLFRNVYTLNMETLQPATQITEPSVSQWIPSTP